MNFRISQSWQPHPFDAMVLGKLVYNSLWKRVKIHYDQLNGTNVVLRQGLAVSRVRVPGQDSGVDSRVKGLDTSIQNLRETGSFRNPDHTHSLLLQGPCRPASRDDLNSQFGQGAGE